jgi:integrase
LGHIAPHDLRRSAAGILHHARGTDGGHLYDLMDIAHVLDHADTATTQRSYIDVLDKQDVKRRAGHTLD